MRKRVVWCVEVQRMFRVLSSRVLMSGSNLQTLVDETTEAAV